MTLKETLQTAWKNKGAIAEGFFNAYISSSKEIKEEALRRLAICRTNQCGYHDPKGESEKAVFKGAESCGCCGCKLYEKTHAMSVHCCLKDLGQPPLWEAVMTQEQEKEVHDIAFKKQQERDKQIAEDYEKQNQK